MMTDFWYMQLNNRYKEIADAPINKSQIDKVLEAFERVKHFSNTARKEGLLALEEAADALDKNDNLQVFFGQLITLVVDGTDTEDVYCIGMNKILAMNMCGMDGLTVMMYLHGTLMLQAGYNPRVIDEFLQSYFTPEIMNEYKRRESVNALPEELAEAKADEELIKSLCKDDGEIDEKDHSIVSETAKSLLLLSSMEMQRLLRDTGNSSLAIAMKGLPGRVRASVFNNMSPRLAVLLAKDMQYMGPVRMRDVEECCVDIMKILLKLSDRGEIQDKDYSILQVVIDMYDSAEEENRKLRDKYKELRTLINRIYSE